MDSANDRHMTRPLYDGYYKYDRTVAESYDSSREIEDHWSHENRFIERYFRNRLTETLLDLPGGYGSPSQVL